MMCEPLSLAGGRLRLLAGDSSSPKRVTGQGAFGPRPPAKSRGRFVGTQSGGLARGEFARQGLMIRFCVRTTNMDAQHHSDTCPSGRTKLPNAAHVRALRPPVPDGGGR